MPSPENRTVSRRRAIGAGTLAAIAAGLLGTALAEAAPQTPAPIDVPLIDQAEALLLELAAILPQLSDRDVCNVGHKPRQSLGYKYVPDRGHDHSPGGLQRLRRTEGG
jgi:hypothetical protein